MDALLEQIAELIVLANPEDLRALADLHRLFADYGALPTSAAVREVAGAAAMLVEKIILEEVSDKAAAFDVVGATVSVLQSSGGQAFDRIVERLPVELSQWSGVALAAATVAKPASGKSKNRRQKSAGAKTAAAAGESAVATLVEESAASEPTATQNYDSDLIADFLQEAGEHLEAVDRRLMTLEKDPHHREAINEVFRAFHSIKGVASFLELVDIRMLAHESETLLDLVRSQQLTFDQRVADVVFEASDRFRALLRSTSDAVSRGAPIVRDPSVSGLVQRIQLVVSKEAGSAGPEPASSPVPTPASVELRRETSEPTAAAPGALREVVKVDAQRLDRMVEAIGELVIAVAMVRQSYSQESRQNDRQLAQLDKITRDLQEMGTSLRMVPLRSTFQKMTRLARDLAKKLDKPIEFVTVGEDAEMDKTVVDQIGDPLIHMIRNAVDHGVEADPADRERAGKPRSARVELRAFHKGGGIYIEIADDGKGLDRDAILAKARERGLLNDRGELSEREIFQLIFEPGFSTAKTVTDVSGRGVGMDVVKRTIESLRGQVEIESTPGRGTIFSIRLPLTLAVIDGMVLRVGNERYVLPTQSIVRSIRPRAAQLSSVVGNGELLTDLGTLMPLIRLGNVFDVREAEVDPTRAIIVVVRVDGVETGILVDELLGQQQIVIKSLGAALAGTPGIAGGAIMPDGKIGLIVDPDGLVRLSQTRPLSRSAAYASPN